jgi:predicted NBD/HSP70 family sugar kinase
VRTVPNLPQVAGTAFTETVAAALPGTTIFDNDANVALLGEVTAGAARGRGTAVMISIGTGLGASVYLDGRLLTGRTGAVGEFGVLPYADGTLESVMSGAGMVDRARRLGFEVRDAVQIFDRGEPQAVLRDATAALLSMVTTLKVAYEPEVVVLGGGVAPRLAARLDALSWLLDDPTPEPPEIALSTLGDPAGAIGALVAALHCHYRAFDIHTPDLGGVATTLLRSLPGEESHVPAPSA